MAKKRISYLEHIIRMLDNIFKKIIMAKLRMLLKIELARRNT